MTTVKWDSKKKPQKPPIINPMLFSFSTLKTRLTDATAAEKHSLRVRRKLVRDRSVKARRERATSRVFILASVHNWRIPLSSLLPRITEPRCTRSATRETGRRQRRRRFVDTARRHGRVPLILTHARTNTGASKINTRGVYAERAVSKYRSRAA